MVLTPREMWNDIVPHAGSDRAIRLNLPAAEFKITKTRRLALVTQGSQLVGLALARKESRSGAFDSLVSLKELSQIDPPLDLAELLGVLPNGFAERWNGALSWNGILPPATGKRVLQAIEQLRPELADVLSALVAILQRVIEEPSTETVEKREQRDAVALGLEMAGIDSLLALGEGDPPEDVPFLRGLEGATAREDSILRHDAARFAGWMEIESAVVDVWRFEDPVWSARRVTVLYADKTPLETRTGTDLIYFREDTKAFILVQYKRMVDGADGLHYRPDSQLDLEIERFEALGLLDSPATSVAEVRLSAAPFYIKLVEPDITRPEGNHLAKGMYFPLELFQLLRTSPLTRGPRGGVLIGWHTAQRYITNTQFVALVQESWIGTRGAASDAIERIIHDSLSGGRSLVVVSDESDRDKAGGRRK